MTARQAGRYRDYGTGSPGQPARIGRPSPGRDFRPAGWAGSDPGPGTGSGGRAGGFKAPPSRRPVAGSSKESERSAGDEPETVP